MGYIWTGIIGVVILSSIIQWMTATKELEKSDYYGEYIINRNYFPGPQADWQYNTFRFEITDQDSIFFYVTAEEKIIETYTGSISTTTPFSSARLIINMEKPLHHILTSNPTTYRRYRSFYLVLNSPEFYNVFFKKGEWKPI